MQCKIDDLPDELLEYILSLIPPYMNLQKCKLVSKRWCRATKNVIDRNEAHFQRSVAYGSLFWHTGVTTPQVPTIGKRHSHSACTYENSMYVFGGCTGTCTSFNDLWRLDLDSKTWMRPKTIGSCPSPKACATMLRYKKSLILFGGWSQSTPYPFYHVWKMFNELHVYSVETNKWTAIDTDSPPPTSSHSATIHGNQMVVFGGLCHNMHCSSNEVWCLNLDTYIWHKQPTSNLKPRPRYGQSQIELGEKHLLILGGCAGPNTAMNEAWLLEMEGPTWTWKKINMRRTENAPTRIWLQQACKVGNYVIALGKNKRQAKSNDMSSISLKKIAGQRTMPPRLPDTSSLFERQRSTPSVDRDENVNGRHGYLPRSIPRTANTTNPSTFPRPIPLCTDNTLSMAAFRDGPLHNSSNVNRQRQLECLRRWERQMLQMEAQQKPVRRSENTLSIYALDVTNVLREECNASWIQVKQNNHSGPDARIQYSLVVGSGELIVFGGIRKEHATLEGLTGVEDLEVYNDLHFINPPRYII